MMKPHDTSEGERKFNPIMPIDFFYSTMKVCRAFGEANFAIRVITDTQRIGVALTESFLSDLIGAISWSDDPSARDHFFKYYKLYQQQAEANESTWKKNPEVYEIAARIFR
jgi:hypothetical protein